MVTVNGGMVPPLGSMAQGGPREWVPIKPMQEDPSLPGKSDHIAVDNDRGSYSADGAKKQFGAGTVDGQNKSITVHKRSACSIIILVHLRISQVFGCTPDAVQQCVNTFEKGVQGALGDVIIPCPDGSVGCVLSVRLVWHSNSDGGGGGVKPIDVSLACGGGKAGGLTYPGDRIDFRPGTHQGSDESVAAHEIGHNLFGIGSHGPSGWNKEGHNPEPGLMDGNWKTPGEKLSQKEAAVLAARFGCDLDECCKAKPAVKKNVIYNARDAMTVSTTARMASDVNAMFN